MFCPRPDASFFATSKAHSHTHIFYLLVHSQNGARAEPGQSQEIMVFPCGGRSPSAQAVLCCLPRHIWKWMGSEAARTYGVAVSIRDAGTAVGTVCYATVLAPRPGVLQALLQVHRVKPENCLRNRVFSPRSGGTNMRHLQNMTSP